MAIWKVVNSALILGQRVQNVIHFATGPGTFTEEDVYNEFTANWMGVLRNLQNNNLSYTEVAVQRIDPPAGPLILFPITGTNGSLSGAPAPPVLCGLFSIRTAASCRGGHGRFYMFGVHGESVADGVVQSGAYAAYQGAAVNLTNRFKQGGTGPMILVVLPRNNVTNYKSMTSVVVRRTFGIQRRRNIGVGG